MTLGEKLSAARAKRGVSIGSVCRATGVVARETLMQLEGDKQQPENIRLRTALALVDFYAPEITLEDFMGSDFSLRRVKLGVSVRRHAA